MNAIYALRWLLKQVETGVYSQQAVDNARKLIAEYDALQTEQDKAANEAVDYAIADMPERKGEVSV
jgi:hypothetical protein